MFNDGEWLGEDDRNYGGLARIAAGLLLKRSGWGWYRLRSIGLFEAVLNVIPGNGVGLWGGDECLLSIEEWLDPFRALAIAQALEAALKYRPDFRLRLSREIWQWSSLAGAHEALRTHFGKSLVSHGVSFDWPRDRRPARNGWDRVDAVRITWIGDASERYGVALASSLDAASIERNIPNSEVAIARSVKDLVASERSADILVLVSDDAVISGDDLDRLRRGNGARSLLRVPLQNAEAWLSALGTAVSFGAKSLPDGIAEANRSVSGHGDLIASTQSLLLNRTFFAPQLWSREYGVGYVGRGPYDSAAAPRSLEPETEPEPVPATAPPPTKRVLDAAAFIGDRRIIRLPASGNCRIDISIIPKSPSLSSVPDFPDDSVKWDGAVRDLQVHMIELGSAPVTAILRLPRHGPSNTASFDYAIRRGRSMDMRFIVCDENQILQTARFKAAPSGMIEFFVEADFASPEAPKRTFDMALMVNNSLGGRPSATIISPEGVAIKLLDTGSIENARQRAQEILQSAVITGADMDRALVQLASVGNILFRALREEIGEWPQTLERVQLSTQQNAFFPLEFLFDGVVPFDPFATLCPDYRSTIANGLNHCTCDPDADTLCPLGFLGLRVVIERQVWSGTQQAQLWLRQSADVESRTRVTRLNAIAFAASDNADDFELDDDEDENPTLTRTDAIAAELGPRLLDWRAWERAVNNSSPTMGILVPHIDNDGIFIGDNLGVTQARLSFGIASIALVLGCSSAVGVIPLLSIPAQILRDGHTKVVISTLTGVLGRHANSAALTLGRKIRDASNATTSVALGDFVLDMRREFLARGTLAGLVLVALGDADIMLGR